MESALSISHLRKVYRDGKVAVDDLSLDIAPGDFFGFLGPNGAGKSTTIHCVTGIATPTSGTIKIFGVDAVKDYREARRLIGLSPQEFNVDTFATVTPDPRLGWRLFRHAARAAAQARTEMLIEKFDLVPHAKKTFRQLSGGLKRRMILARALMHDPDLLILDEPTAGVDVELRLDLWRYLQELNKEGKTILLTSHYLEEIERLCRTIAIINHGRIVRHADKARVHRRDGRRGGGLSHATGARPSTLPQPGSERDDHQLDRPFHDHPPRDVAADARAHPGVRGAVDFGAAIHLHLRLCRGRAHFAHRRPQLSRIRAAGHRHAERGQRRVPAVLVPDLFRALHALCRGDAGLAARPMPR